MRSLHELLSEPGRVEELTPEEALAAVEQLAVFREALVRRARGGSASGRTVAVPAQEDRLLTAQEVAERCQCSVAWVYRQARRWPFARKLSHKVLRVSEAGLLDYLKKRPRAGV